MDNYLKQKLQSIPDEPGCYLWKNKNDEIIYIGKAKNLKKRTNQYFNKTFNNKTQKLVSQIFDLDYIVVSSEAEALILESNLIKKYRPFYNFLLKEGSDNFSYIAITYEKNPRIIYTKNKNLEAKYYGPFVNFKDFNAYELFLLLNRIFPLRKCNTLPNKVCMYYHLNQCLGPCVKNIDKSTYDEIIEQIDDIFNHQAQALIKSLETKEKQAADKLEFEQAQVYCDYIKQLKHIVNHQMVQLKKMNDLDIIGFYEVDQELTIIIFNYFEGKLLSKHQSINIIHDDVNEVLLSYLVQYYQNHQVPKEIYIKLHNNQDLELLNNVLKTKIINPQKGIYADLVSLAIKNAQEYYQKQKLKQASDLSRTVEANEALKQLLNLKELNTIEMIDNSNTFLEFPVSAVVHFENSKPNKKMYRKYNLKTKINASDIYYMQEVMIRKFAKHDAFIPDLLILDGGINQLRAVKEILEELNIWNKINVIGLVKNNKHQTEAIITKNFETIKIDKHSGLYHYLKNIQDEAHRFAITFHRKKRDSKISSFLDDIDGIGPKTKEKIIKLFPNLYDLKNVNISTLEQIVPKKALEQLLLKIKKELNND